MSHATNLYSRTAASLFAAVVAVSGLAHAGTYHITYKTRNIADAGTDGKIQFRLWGDNTYKVFGGASSTQIYSKLGWASLKGSQDRGAEEEDRYDLLDQGPCTGIQFSNTPIDSWFPNDWDVEWVRVKHLPTGAVSTFDLFAEVRKGQSLWFPATRVEGRPKLQATPDGQLKRVNERVQVVKFFDNEFASASAGATTSQEWSFGETVGFTKELSESMDLSVTVSYESPQTVAGTFGASATAAYGESQTNAQENVANQGYAETLTLNWDLPDHASIIKVFNLSIPWEFQNYIADTTKLRMRKLGAKMSLAADAGRAIEIPNRDREGNVVPLPWSEIASLLDVMRILDDATARDIESRKKSYWIGKGWVVEDNAPAKPAPGSKPIVAAALESGVYKDNLGLYMELDVHGASLSVKNYSAALMEHWQSATGSIVGSEIHDIRFMDDGKVAFTAAAKISADARRIEFNNGHWAYFGADIAAIPASERNPVAKAPAPAAPTAPTTRTVVKMPAPAKPRTVTVTRPQPADLVADFKKFIHANGKVTVQLRVSNRGGTASASSIAQVYLSKNKKVDPRRDAGLGEESVPELAPGASALVTFQGRLSAEEAHGMRVVAMLDVRDTVAESDEANVFRGGMKLQVDRVGSTERSAVRSERKMVKQAKKDKKAKKKGGKKNRKK